MVPDNFLTLLTYKDMFNNKPDKDYLLKVFRKSNYWIIDRLARINLFLSENPRIDFNKLLELLNDLPDYKKNKIISFIRKKFKENSDFVIFNKIQILKFMEGILIFNEKIEMGELSEKTRPTNNLIDKVVTGCLVINDFIINANTVNKNNKAVSYKDFIPFLLPSYEYVNKPIPMHFLGRMWYINKNLINKIDKNNVISNLFKKEKGVKLEEFYLVLFSLIVVLSNEVRRNDFLKNSPYIELGKVFKKVKINLDTVKKVIDVISISQEDLHTELLNIYKSEEKFKEKIENYNFLAFKKYPLIHIKGDKYICVDLHFLMDKFFSEELWIGGKREELNSIWGKIFEKYLIDFFLHLEKKSDKKIEVFPNLSVKGNEISDIVVKIGNNILLIESKFSILTAKSKYNKNWESLKKELDEKFVFQKGCRQLVKAINKLYKEHSNNELKKRGIDVDKIDKIIPIIVFYDKLFTFTLLKKYFKEHFDTILTKEVEKEIKRKVSDLKILYIDEVENLEIIKNEDDIVEVLLNEVDMLEIEKDYKKFVLENFMELANFIGLKLFKREPSVYL